MAVYPPFLMGLLQAADLLVAAYLVAIAFRTYWRDTRGSFSRVMGVMVVAGVLFFAAQMAQFFALLPAGIFEALQALFSLVFLMLLVLVVREIRKGMLAHDHLVKRRQRPRLADVE